MLTRAILFMGLSLKARGADGIIGIGRKFRIIDKDRSGTCDFQEFTQMINGTVFLLHSFPRIICFFFFDKNLTILTVPTECDLKWTGEQIKLVFAVFDKDKSGSLNYDEFLREVRGTVTEVN